jgi:hypothetical protein
MGLLLLVHGSGESPASKSAQITRKGQRTASVCQAQVIGFGREPEPARLVSLRKHAVSQTARRERSAPVPKWFWCNCGSPIAVMIPTH